MNNSIERISDLGTIAYLFAKGISSVGHSKDGRKVFFHFDKNSSSEMLQEYRHCHALIEARKMAQAMRDVKSMIFEV